MDSRGGGTGSEQPYVQSVTRALALLGCFATEVPELRLTELARETGLSLSTTHRLVRTMVAAGFLWHDQRSERYVPGPELISLSKSVLDIDDTASLRATLYDLAEQLRLGVAVAIRTSSTPYIGAASTEFITDNRTTVNPLQVPALADFITLSMQQDWAAQGQPRSQKYLLSPRIKGVGLRCCIAPIHSPDGVLIGVLVTWGRDNHFIGPRSSLVGRVIAAGAGALQLPPSTLSR